MSLLRQNLSLNVSQKQILTPGLVQLVTVLQLNRLELKELISTEIAQNPVLDESVDGSDELTPAEVQDILERHERAPDPSDAGFLEMTSSPQATGDDAPEPFETTAAEAEAAIDKGTDAAPASTDPFEEIDYGSFFEDYLDPGHKSPAQENSEKPSFETFLSSPVTLAGHLEQQLALLVMPERVRDAADAIIGNLNEDGYLLEPLEEIAGATGAGLEHLRQALALIQTLDPAGVGARNLRECLLLQLESRGARDGVAWDIVERHLNLIETKQFKELARVLNRPLEHINIAIGVIRKLDPRPGVRYSGPGARQIQPDVYITKEGTEYVIALNDDDLPQLRLNGQYRRMLDREQTPDKDVRNYVKERFQSALLLMKNIEQRKRTIMQVCEHIVHRQTAFLDHGLVHLRPMMIKEIAEIIGVHASTVSRAVANKYAHTPQGVFELRFFFSEAVQGSAGTDTPLLVLKHRVKKMIEEEDSRHPLTDDQITARLRADGVDVTRRTVAKYREDMKIPSTHQRRVRD